MIKWNSENSLTIDDVNFELTQNKDLSGKNLDFKILKPKSKIEKYIELGRGFSPKTIFELGFGLGGSTVFFDKLFEPGRISAIDISTSKIHQLEDYLLQHSKFMNFHYGVKQSDISKLGKIIEKDFLNSPIDLVIDDASHWYNPTKKSFGYLFPLLSGGGKYIIETWAWSFKKAQQSKEHSWYKKNSLVNLVFECITELASNSLISNIEIKEDMVIITRSNSNQHQKIFTNNMLRDRQLPKL